MVMLVVVKEKEHLRSTLPRDQREGYPNQAPLEGAAQEPTKHTEL